MNNNYENNRSEMSNDSKMCNETSQKEANVRNTNKANNKASNESQNRTENCQNANDTEEMNSEY